MVDSIFDKEDSRALLGNDFIMVVVRVTIAVYIIGLERI